VVKNLDGVIGYIGIGSNLGDAEKNCKDAIVNLSGTNEILVTAIASFYNTEPVGMENQNWFVNTVAEIKTVLSARNLLYRIQSIENYLGRKRETKGGPRSIDLDLLFYDQYVINEVDLVIPHPELHKRRFVLEPLNEIASYFIHPVFNISIRGLKDRLNDQKIVELIEN
jgi:2-amino-4-hydroxy-6-hydroxymethyldihydropteridine diphosphokinase